MVMVEAPALSPPAFSYILPVITGLDDLIALMILKFGSNIYFLSGMERSNHMPLNSGENLLTVLQFNSYF
jgi:hypothetical protein